MPAPKNVEDTETLEIIGKFVQKETILNSIENTLETRKLQILQRLIRGDRDL